MEKIKQCRSVFSIENDEIYECRGIGIEKDKLLIYVEKLHYMVKLIK